MCIYVQYICVQYIYIHIYRYRISRMALAAYLHSQLYLGRKRVAVQITLGHLCSACFHFFSLYSPNSFEWVIETYAEWSWKFEKATDRTNNDMFNDIFLEQLATVAAKILHLPVTQSAEFRGYFLNAALSLSFWVSRCNNTGPITVHTKSSCWASPPTQRGKIMFETVTCRWVNPLVTRAKTNLSLGAVSFWTILPN